MSQDQPRKTEAVKYGHVFDISGGLASQPIAPQDAAALQAAEQMVIGHIPKGGPAAVVQSAADINERRGLVERDEMTDAVRERGVTIAEADIGGYRVITEAIGGQVIGQYSFPEEVQDNPDPDAITIGEALEATALSAGEKPVDSSDAAAIQAAEVRATGLGHVAPGGLGLEAQSAAARNRRASTDDENTKLGDILPDATVKLGDDKPVTKEVAEAVIQAEMRNKADKATCPVGVSASVAAAARLNLEE